MDPGRIVFPHHNREHIEINISRRGSPQQHCGDRISAQRIPAAEILLRESAIKAQLHSSVAARLARILSEPQIETESNIVSPLVERRIWLEAEDVGRLSGKAASTQADEVRSIDARKHLDRHMLEH